MVQSDAKTSRLTARQEEIFIYDRRLFLSPSSTPVPFLSSYTPPPHPEPPSLKSPKDVDLATWQELFERRRRWAHAIAEVGTDVIVKLRELDRERDTMSRGTLLAVTNMSKHTIGLKSKFEDAQRWSDAILEDQHYLLENWQGSVAYYSAVDVIPELVQCIKTGSEFSGGSGRASLADMVDATTLRDLAKLGHERHRQLSDHVADVTVMYDEMVKIGRAHV